MNQFESNVKQIPYSQQRVYDKLSDLSNLEQFTELLQQEQEKAKIKIEDLAFDSDSISCSVSPVGKLELRIVEREEPKCVKFEATTSPIPLTLWIQILPVTEETSKMKLTLRTELNIFLKGMLQKPLKEGVEKLAEMLSQIPY
ncbi:MAG: SRPBCC family protein [Bacteroidaceae bacterium]|nr:SRPBCC family protein [Bacteroidaceae bacterium]MBP5322734.1 SRPBCC family protein [Bacteroidaceae bacterium]